MFTVHALWVCKLHMGCVGRRVLFDIFQPDLESCLISIFGLGAILFLLFRC